VRDARDDDAAAAAAAVAAAGAQTLTRARARARARSSEKCFIFVCNVSLEYERSEINSSFSYKSAEDRERMVAAERKFTDDRVRQIIEFKRRVVGDSDKNFLVINQKGIDPISLDLLDKEKIIGIRRAKRRNMERLALACGGYAVNSLDDLKEDCLGYADVVYEHTLGDDKFTFIEGCRNPRSCTILVTGPTEHSIKQTKDALRDGLMAVANLIEDGSLVAGAGAFEVAAHRHLMNKVVPETQGREKMGVRAFADALLTIPKTLAENAGLDASETVIAVVDAAAKGVAGVDLETGRPSAPITEGIWDNYRVKKQFVHLSALIACKLLLVDEVMRAGKKLNKEE
jgi:T-complex protein 1 subunit zeta